MPGRSTYSTLHGNHLESSLLGHMGTTSGFDLSSSLLALEIQRQSRRRHILRLEAHERNLSKTPRFETKSTKSEESKKETDEKDSEKCAKELEQWIKKLKCTTGMQLHQFKDIKVGVLDVPLDLDAETIEPYPRLVEGEKYKFKGAKDDHGEFRGKGTIEFDNGDSIVGYFVGGQRHGECRIETSRKGLNGLIGTYHRGQLEGKVKLYLSNGHWMEAFCKNGVLHGFARQFDDRGRLQMVGNFRSGRRSGVWWKMIKGGGAVVGRVSKEGQLTGYRIAYLYPDFKTALVGSFNDGILESAQEAQLKTYIENSGIKVPIFTEAQGPTFKREIATHEFMTSSPLLEDPYERKTIEVKQSGVCGGGEGVFARVKLEPNTVAAFYNGRRVLPRDWLTREHETWEDNAYKIFDPNNKKATIDIPIEYRSLQNYRASCAHKTNHSFLPNAEFVSFDHPRFGLIPCILTTHDVNAGEEIFVHYGYDLEDAPEWYEQAWQTGNYPIPDAMKRWQEDSNPPSPTDPKSIELENCTNGITLKTENGLSLIQSENGDLNGVSPGLVQC